MKKLLYRISFYFTRLFYIVCGVIVCLFILAFFFPKLQQVGSIAALCVGITVLLDLVIVYSKKQPVTVNRLCAERFSNGDENKVVLEINNHLPYKVTLEIIDELPFQFQLRNWKRRGVAETGISAIEYTLKPLERGVYTFGIVNVFVTGVLRMVVRHIRTGEEKEAATYPSYMQMRRFQLMAATNQLQEAGSRQMRKLGNSLEFEQIREYVLGDDYRTINWKASARKNAIMVNNFMDERSQQVICVIDKGRTMKMPFEGMSLLDYAINASLVLSNVVLHKQDKAGLLTFGSTVDQYIAPDKKATQLGYILEALYRQETNFMDSDFEALYSTIRYRVKQRSLLLLFTNFESMYGMERQLPYLKKLSTNHPLLVIFFENTELGELINQRAQNLEEIYQQTIASKFAFEKRQMVRELNKHGIMAMLTTPQKLTVNALNKYFELKARQVM
ncbi:Uncharacterized conserved protein, DUF58 family, contains vWF domain [Filimonas lacunae]|uniref:Uncharacterized conserved protein, DUF58 family, contains vWF domain n=1 Tax=Filimonas lacunae TaxID=477680 RepID=A0A173MEY6_9BACT|nr:DUF58 domain-containing protein [Filimonas lacunae]BAV06080.1 cell division protein DivIC (FtsB), stabilizes FtsL against RasP cleavage [Filimonas lacunae]SIT24566.1 Uncharacterized conserved protein, DUF58 family, contains vWF domain [Filimonas lacunae]